MKGRQLTNETGSKKIRILPLCGPVAQLGARFHGMEEVVGSIPTRSTKPINDLAVVIREQDYVAGNNLGTQGATRGSVLVPAE